MWDGKEGKKLRRGGGRKKEMGLRPKYLPLLSLLISLFSISRFFCCPSLISYPFYFVNVSSLM